MTPRVLLVSALSALLGLPALGAELAVLDLDGYGLPYDDVLLVTQGLRDAVLEEGSFYPLDEFEIADRLSEGHQSELEEAREEVAEGRRALELGSAGYALMQLSDALRLHETVGSPIGRRPELADAYYFTGVALLRSGRSREAAEHFLETERLFSSYLDTRAPAPSASIRSAYERAVAALADADRSFPPTAELQAIADRLRVDALIVGWIDDEAAIQARLIQAGKVAGEVRTTSISGVPYPGDPVFAEIITELYSDIDVSAPLPASSSPSAESAPTEPPIFAAMPEFDEPVDADEDPYAEPEVVEVPAQEAPKRTFMRKNQMGKIKSSGRIRYSDGPITSKWWFWTAAGALVVGGGTTAAVITLNNIDAGPEPAGGVDDAPTYTVSLEAGE